jgi:hypothetical protein
MAWRTVTGVVIGLVLWVFLFFAVGIGIGQVLPEYREAARLMFQESDTSGFGTPQLLLNFLLFTLVGLVVGWVATVVGRNRVPALALGVLFLVWMLVNHYFIEWDAFPAWYNIVVPFVISLSILAGGRIRSATA